MKKSLSRTLLIVILAGTTLFSSSCATVFGGRVTDCQRTRPDNGEKSRKVRVGALVLDILLFWPSVAVDFATNAIYKPCN